MGPTLKRFLPARRSSALCQGAAFVRRDIRRTLATVAGGLALLE